MPPEAKPRDKAKGKVGAALVVGGGIGGMQAALDLAAAGIKVYLAEKQPAIGGVMAQLDKTFPTNDCAMCTMAPRLVEIGRHKNIDILTLSEVERIEGRPGNFTVTIKRQPRFVDETKCTGCGACTAECPVTLPSEFDHGLGERKAIFRSFPQAVPNVFSISRRGTSPCQAACPVHQDGQGYVTLIAQRRFDEALQVILRDNALPSICGRVCTHPCTSACTRAGVDDPVNLPALKRFVTDYCADYKLPQPSVPDRPEKVAIIGSGPSGLVCAYQLRQKGYRPTIFEALSTPGGMLTVGIPSYRLPRKLLNAEIDRMRAIGIEILLDTPVGRSIAFEELRKRFAAVFIAIGAHVERKLAIPGENLPGVAGGVEFLRRVNLEKPVAPGQRVLVIGGGNSALDAARTALRCGAKDVTIVYRRTRAEMPADVREIEDAAREGIKLMFLTAPKSFQAGADGRVAGLECLNMKLGKADASGRPAPEPIPGSEFVLPCDGVIVSIGQFPDVGALGERLGVETTKWGTLKADPRTLETGLPGVFAGGDCVTGPDVVVNAKLAGKKAATSIDRYLNHEDMRIGREWEGPYQTEYVVDTTGVLMQRQIHMQALEQRLASGDAGLSSNGGRLKTVVMIQCVGSRDAEHPHCSRICCSEAIKNALRIKAIAPETHVYVLYRDIRTYGFKESYYTQARQRGVVFVRYQEDRKPEVARNANNNGLQVTVFDRTLGLPIAIAADLVVLSAGVEPHPENRELAQLLKVPVNAEGFFLEAHMKLRPVDFMTDGVFLCGLAHSPKTVEETILQAQAAAARAAAILTQDRVEMEANVSEVLDGSCDGCAYCVDTCPFKAISLLDYMWQGSVKKVVEANETICKGCGCCQATCPKNAIFVRGFTLGQIEAQIHAALGVSE
jgi:heterodisulfide reductase subunit A-like polyferredoxin